MPKFRYPVNDTTEEVADDPEFFQSDVWDDYDPDEGYEDDDFNPFDVDEEDDDASE